MKELHPSSPTREPDTRSRQRAILAICCVSMLIAVMDVSVVNKHPT